MIYLESNDVYDIALQLDEDVHGANGDLDNLQIHHRLMQAIADACSSHRLVDSDLGDVNKPALTLCLAADLVLGIWRYKEREAMALLSDAHTSSPAWPA